MGNGQPLGKRKSPDNTELSNSALSTQVKSIEQRLQWDILSKMLSWFKNLLENNEQPIFEKSPIIVKLQEIINQQDSEIIELKKSTKKAIENINELYKIIDEQDKIITKLDKQSRKANIDKDILIHDSSPGEQNTPHTTLISLLTTLSENELFNLAKKISLENPTSSLQQISRICSKLCEIILVGGMNEDIEKEDLIGSLQSDVERGLNEISIKIKNIRTRENLNSSLKKAVQLLTEIKDSTMQGELYWIDSNTPDENQFEHEKHEPMRNCQAFGEIKFTVYPGYFTKNELEERTYHLKATVWTELIPD